MRQSQSDKTVFALRCSPRDSFLSDQVDSKCFKNKILLPVTSMRGPILEASFSTAAASAHVVCPEAPGRNHPRPARTDGADGPGRRDERAHSPFSRAPEPTDRLRSMWGRERERIEARRAATCRGRKKTILLAARWVKHEEYTVWRTLGRDVLFCFISEVLVTNWAAQ